MKKILLLMFIVFGLVLSLNFISSANIFSVTDYNFGSGDNVTMKSYGIALENTHADAVTSFKENFISDYGTNQSVSSLDGEGSFTATRYNQTWLDFDGDNDYVDFGNDASLNTSDQDFTVMAFVYPDNLTTTVRRDIVTKSKAGAREFILATRETNKSNMIVWTDAGGIHLIATGNELSTGEWHHITGWVNGSQASMYDNGMLSGTDSTIAGVRDKDGTSKLLVGDIESASAGEVDWDGRIADIRLYNKTLDSKQIRRIYNESSFGSGLGKSIPVLSYHKIETPSDVSTEVNLTDFTAQMDWLNSSGYETITYDNWKSWRDGSYALPEKPIILVFDDGWLSVFTNATPVMDDYDFIGVVSIITGKALNVANYMNWTQIQNLSDKGWQIASHSFNASSVINYSSADLLRAFNDTKYQIEGNISILPTLFIYPNNENNDTTDDECAKYYTMCSGQSGSTNTQESFLFKTANLTHENGNPIGFRRILIRNITTLTELQNAVDYHDGLILHTKFNENQGTTVYDLSGEGNNGTITGATWNNDGVSISLTEGIDYNIYRDTDLFELLNIDLDKTGINVSYDNSKVLWLKMTDDATDSSGNGNDGFTTTATHNLSWYEFDGVNDRIISTKEYNFNFSQGFSLSAWSKTENADLKALINFRGGYRPQISLQANKDQTSLVMNMNTSCYKVASGTAISNTGDWQLNTVVWNGTHLFAYTNGVVKATSDAGSCTNFDNYTYGAGYLTVGATSIPDSEFNGSIDEVIIYNTSLTSTEITALYNKGLFKHLPEYGNYTSGILDAGQIVNWTNINWTYSNETENQNVTLWARTGEIAKPDFADSSLVSMWSLNQSDTNSSKTLAKDIVGNNDGVALGGMTVGEANGVFQGENATSFDGVDDKITITDSPTLEYQNFTISGWINPLSGGNYPRVYSKDENSGVYVSMSATNLRITIEGENSVSFSTPFGSWVHFTFVKNGTDVWKYKNGVLVGSADTYTGGIIPYGAGAGVIGNRADSLRPFNGSIAYVSIFNKSLTQDEIINWSTYTGELLISQGETLDLPVNRYLQYQAKLQTNDTKYTPILTEVNLEYENTFPVITFGTQTPSDIMWNSTGFFNIPFNITDEDGINESSIVVFHGVNHSHGSVEHWNWSNRVLDKKAFEDWRGCNRNESEWWESVVWKESSNDIWSFAGHDTDSDSMSLIDNSAIHSYWNYTHDPVQLMFPSSWYVDRTEISSENKTNQYIEIYKNRPVKIAYNLSVHDLTENFTSYDYLNIEPQGSSYDLINYVCNSSYSTGNPVNSDYCQAGFHVTGSESRTLTMKNSSYIEKTNGGTEGSYGQVVLTNNMFLVLTSSDPTSANAYRLYYANNSVTGNTNFNETNVMWTSVNNGVAYTQYSGTPDFWHSPAQEDYDKVVYYVYVCDNFNNCVNSTWQEDTLQAEPNLPPIAPTMTNPLESYNETIPFYINWTTAGDPEGDDYNASVYLYNTDGTLNTTLADNNITDDITYFYVEDTNILDGLYRINITLCDQADCSSTLTGWNFTINNIPDLNVSLGSGISSLEFRPAYYNQQDIWATNQTRTKGVFNLTNNASAASGDVYIELNQTQSGWEIECNNQTSGVWMNLTTSSQKIYSSLSAGSYFNVWCRADIGVPTANFKGKILFSIT